ncbi:MAG: hypothetical protein QM704_09545 [Anaeromyxobacteraceae bacterium]
MRSHLSAVLAAVLSTGCTAALETRIPSDEAARRRPENASGVLVDGELARLTWLQPLVRDADPSGFGVFRPGDPVHWLVVSRAAASGSVLTFSGPSSNWRDNLVHVDDRLWAALAEARATSPFHAPVQARMGEATFWAIGDLVPEAVTSRAGESLGTIEVYASDPRSDRTNLPRPVMVMAVARRSPDGAETVRRPETLGIVGRSDGFFVVERFARSPEGRLTSLAFASWRPDVQAVLRGQVAADVLGDGAPFELKMEKLLTEALLEWKTRGLQPWAAGATPLALEDAVVAAEKGMLELDRRSRVVKDEIDAKARAGAGSQPELTEKAQLLDQRKAVVAAVIATLKAARAARAAP